MLCKLYVNKSCACPLLQKCYKFIIYTFPALCQPFVQKKSGSRLRSRSHLKLYFIPPVRSASDTSRHSARFAPSAGRSSSIRIGAYARTARAIVRKKVESIKYILRYPLHNPSRYGTRLCRHTYSIQGILYVSLQRRYASPAAMSSRSCAFSPSTPSNFLSGRLNSYRLTSISSP